MKLNVNFTINITRKKVAIAILSVVSVIILAYIISQSILYPKLTFNQLRNVAQATGVDISECDSNDDTYNRNFCTLEEDRELRMTISSRENGDFIHDDTFQRKTKHCYAKEYPNKELLFGYNWVITGSFSEIEKIQKQIGGNIVHQDCIGNLMCDVLTPSDCSDYF